ncbi:hypothetical protein AGRA3207_007872 (plasmid) [Actinomadura graeca]|uniref:HPt domain-containing protein n=1 Tax=Actinomadura graeca TaxID=2750812 RepID=A0ABX8R973_9ACTN|nr:hypothetical protein [Actinomadura graeca]QXJ27071.1 hypothetical protein AGRA3207_007872 [Actinomadura graeca]
MSVLEDLEMSPDDTRELIGSLEGEAPAVAHLMTALADLAEALENEELLDAVYEQSTEMRRPHVRVLVGVLGHALDRLCDGFGAVELESRLAEAPEALDSWESAMESAREALTALAEDLARPRGERGDRDR